MVRFKNRWLLVEFISCAPPPDPPAGSAETSSRHVWAALKQSVLTHFGDTGWGAVGASLTVKYFSPRTNVCIVRVARDQHRTARAAVTLLAAIDGRRCVPHVVHVSGTYARPARSDARPPVAHPPLVRPWRRYDQAGAARRHPA
ncbi:hypothetical protein AcV5_008850 [Taiwanofungus camphoratus]|nr:hypothetical protein AcV5_008850 [Antrodia cinnamomea]